MTANEINQILAAAANGMSADQIADMLDDQDAEGRMDALHAFDNDDSDWASEQRAEMAGCGKYDFNEYARNDAGEYVNFM